MQYCASCSNQRSSPETSAAESAGRVQGKRRWYLRGGDTDLHTDVSTLDRDSKKVAYTRVWPWVSQKRVDLT